MGRNNPILWQHVLDTNLHYGTGTIVEHPDDINCPGRHVRIPSDVAHDSEDSVHAQKMERGDAAGLDFAVGQGCARSSSTSLDTWSKLEPVIRCALGVGSTQGNIADVEHVSHTSPYLPSANSICAHREVSSSSYVSKHQLDARIFYLRHLSWMLRMTRSRARDHMHLAGRIAWVSSSQT